MRAFRLGGLLAARDRGARRGGGRRGRVARAGPHGSRVVGHVYVNDNTAPVNTVAGFDRHADGSLTPIPGSPFAVGGAGTGHGDASQGSLQLSADGRYLLAVDAGSNQISVLRIKPDGSLQAAAGSPVSSAASTRSASRVTATSSTSRTQAPAATPATRTTPASRSTPAATCRPIPDSTYVLPNDSKPGQVLFNSDGDQARRHPHRDAPRSTASPSATADG